MANSQSINTDIAVLGAGLVGLAATIALAELGKRVTLIDASKTKAKPSKTWDSRIYALTPASEVWLKAIGVWSSVKTERVNDVEGMALWSPEVSIPLCLSADDANISKLACIVENQNLIQAMWQKVKQLDIHVVSGHSCQNLRYEDDQIIVDLDGGYHVIASLLVAADGAHSFVRQTLDIPTKVKQFGQTALVANFIAERDHGNVARQWFSPHTTLALLPLADQHVSMVWAMPNELIEEVLSLTGEAIEKRVQDETRNILGALSLVGKTLSFPLQQETAVELIRKRVVLIGDAAHRVHPMAGQGANLGFRDVMALEALIKCCHQLQDIGEKQFLRQYERTRKTDVLKMNTLTSGLDGLFALDSPIVKQALSLGMPMLNQHSEVKKMLIKQAVA